MRHFCSLLLFIFVSLSVSSQHIYKIKTDSLLVTNDSCTAELNLENSTKFVNGFLYNKGKGRTEFRRAMIKLTDSTYLFGDDTLNFRRLLNTIGFSGTNIYNSNGTVTADRTVTLGTNRLNFSTDGSFRSSFSGSPFSFQIVDNGGWDMGITRFGASVGPPNIIFMKTRGVNADDNVSLVNNDYLMRIAAVGVTANNSLPGQESLRIFAGVYPTGGVPNFSNGAVPSTTAMPTSFNIATNGVSDGLLSRFSIYPDGEVILANMNASPSATSTQITSNRYKLQVFGNASVTGNFLLNATQGVTAHSSAQLEIVSTTKGFLPPRWTKSQRMAITTPAIGLIGYQTDSSENLYVNKSTGWKKILTEDNLNDAANIFNSNGSLNSNRFVNLDVSQLSFGKNSSAYLHLFNNGNVWLGNNVAPTDAGYNLDVNGTSRFKQNITYEGNIVPANPVGYGSDIGITKGSTGWGPALIQHYFGGNATANKLMVTYYGFHFNETNSLPSVNGQGFVGLWQNSASTAPLLAGGIGTNNVPTIRFFKEGLIQARTISAPEAEDGYRGNPLYIAGGNPPAATIEESMGTNLFLKSGPSYGTGTNGWTTDRSLYASSVLFQTSDPTGTVSVTQNAYTTKMIIYGINQNVGIGTTTPVVSAALDIASTTKGFLPPRWTMSQRSSINTPATGLIGYQTDNTENLYLNKSTGWKKILTEDDSPAILSGSFAIDFNSTNAGTASDITVTLNGAAEGDVVSLGAPNSSVITNTCFTAWVSAADTVTIRFNNYSGNSADPAIGTFKIKILK